MKRHLLPLLFLVALPAAAWTRAADHRIAAKSAELAPPDLRLVSVDPLRLREVLTNLLSNALHHTPAKGVISIDLSTTSDRITVKVADTGTGIAAKDLPRIFDRFHKGATSRGSGLGLAIARNLVTAHGGLIKADSQPGRGTTITFSLPTGE